MVQMTLQAPLPNGPHSVSSSHASVIQHASTSGKPIIVAQAHPTQNGSVTSQPPNEAKGSHGYCPKCDSDPCKCPRT